MNRGGGLPILQCRQAAGEKKLSNITIDLTSNRAAIEKFPYDTWAKVMRGILSEKENVLLDTVPLPEYMS